VPRFLFWDSPQWATYCAAYGLDAPADNNSPENVILPLGEPGEMLARMRHDHRYTVRKRLGGMNAHWSRERSDFDLYQWLHGQASGRMTRPQKTWDLMYEFIQQGFGEVLIVRTEGEPIGASYFYLYEKGVYWGSSARLPALERRYPIGHFMVWEAMLRYAHQNYDYIDLGRAHPETDPTNGIGIFKHGWIKEGRTLGGAPQGRGGSMPSPSAV